MPSLVVLGGKSKGTVIDLSEGAEFEVGTARKAAVHLRDKGISYQHAKLVKRNGALVVIDLASPGGTFVNKQRIQTERELRPGDVLGFGETEARFEDPTGALAGGPSPVAAAAEPAAAADPGPPGSGKEFVSALSPLGDGGKQTKRLPSFAGRGKRETDVFGAPSAAAATPPSSPPPPGVSPPAASVALAPTTAPSASSPPTNTPSVTPPPTNAPSASPPPTNTPSASSPPIASPATSSPPPPPVAAPAASAPVVEPPSRKTIPKLGAPLRFDKPVIDKPADKATADFEKSSTAAVSERPSAPAVPDLTPRVRELEAALEQARAESSENASRAQSLEVERDELATALEQTKAENQLLLAAGAEESTFKGRLEARVQELESELREKDAVLKEAVDGGRKLAEQLTASEALSRSKSELEARVAALEADLDQAKSDGMEAHGLVERAEAALASAHAEFDAERARLEEALAAAAQLEGRVATLEESLAAATARFESERAELEASHARERAELEASLAAASAGHEAQLAAAKSSSAEHERAAVAGESAHAAALEARVAELQEKAATLEARLAEALGQLAAAAATPPAHAPGDAATLAALTARVADLESQLANSPTREQYEELHTEATAQVTELEAALEKVKAHAAETEKQRDEARASLEELNADLVALGDENDELRKRLEGQ